MRTPDPRSRDAAPPERTLPTEPARSSASPADGSAAPPSPPPSSPPPSAPPGGRRASAAASTPGGEPAPARPGLDDRARGLDPRIVQVWRLMTALGLSIPFAAATVVGLLLLGRLGWLVPLTGLVLLVVLAGWYPRARYERWRWQLTRLALELRHGVVVHQHEAVPYFRIQQIDVAQGPLDRLLDLATLQVTTASASGSVSLPGISAADAPTVRAELLARAAQAVAEHPGELSDAV